MTKTRKKAIILTDQQNEIVSQLLPGTAGEIAEILGCGTNNVRKVLKGRHSNPEVWEVAKALVGCRNQLKAIHA